MPLFNPFAGLRHLGKVPRFLADLASDLKFLVADNLAPKSKKPPQHWFFDKATYCAAVTSLAREHKFRVVHQAVRKQFIRRTLWYRFGICYLLLGPAVISFLDRCHTPPFCGHRGMSADP